MKKFLVYAAVFLAGVFILPVVLGVASIIGLVALSILGIGKAVSLAFSIPMKNLFEDKPREPRKVFNY